MTGDDRLFAVGPPTDRERAELRARNRAGVVPLFELEAPGPLEVPACAVCAGDHLSADCRHGAPLELLEGGER